MKDNPTIIYLRDVLGIELEQIDNELKKQNSISAFSLSLSAKNDNGRY